ncbi:MAG: D-alanine--D-alanine ligase [Candidatus Omnitrophica bacterium]|nr:D-alanine--D-alanine ligase [Candidatus Omnitrophota bacterium]MDD4012739.1 D-alanine--D-alanine ligase [Candidatus Omnitrophota bacterium]
MNDYKNDLKERRIGVLAGGYSSEREISLKSGKAIFDALTASGLNAKFVDVAGPSLEGMEDIDVAFIALHGRFGEDGTLQQMLQEKGMPYTGSGPEASRAALDKITAKKLFENCGLKIAEHIVVKKSSPLGNIPCPCVVKPRYEGSSVGLSVVKDPIFLRKAVDEASAYDEDIMIERFIPGRELTVGVIEDRALPVVEIVAAGGVYDFAAKYRAGDTKYIVPADLPERTYKAVQEAGLKAHRALGCEGYSRVDVRLGDDGRPYVLEVNTIPGMTERSLLPMAARSAGMDFTALCLLIVRIALKRENSSGVTPNGRVA